MLKRFLVIFITIMLVLGMVVNVNAAETSELDTTLKVIEKASETKYLENDQGFISKTIVDSNADTGEVTIELKLSNTKKEEETSTKKYENTEIFIIIPEYKNTSENEKINYIETLASKILSANSNTKIGIIGVQGPISDTVWEDGKAIKGERDETSVNGTENNAECIVTPTDDVIDIKNKLRNMNSEKESYYPNFQAAIRLARKSFTENTNKIVISLYDDVPITSIGTSSKLPTYGGLWGQYATVEQACEAFMNKLITNTKSEVLTLKEANIDFILLRPDDTNFDKKVTNSQGEVTYEVEGKPYADELYGTIENPTYGKMYALTEESLEEIIENNIYEDVMEKIQNPINTVKIVDYFPEDITENFEFSYVGTPSVGTASEKIDEETKTISWDIGTLKGDEVATLKYKLKIKDMKNTELLNKTIATNEKVVLTYKEIDAKDYTVTLDSSPKIQLSEVKEELTATVSYDPTTSTKGKVTATIKINKKVNPVSGWTISEDGTTLTKEFTVNMKETVHLVDIDEMTKDVVVEITNIQQEEAKNDTTKENTSKDDTTATGKLPNAGTSAKIIISIVAVSIIALIAYKKCNEYKDVK